MKLKSFIAAALMTASLSSFAVDITLSPIYTAVDLVRTALGSAVGVVSSPFASTAASSAQREQLEAIRSDAVEFLANTNPNKSEEDMSDSLKETIKALRAEKELANKSLIELTAAIVTAIN